MLVQNVSSHDYTVASVLPQFMNGSAWTILGFRPSWADPTPAHYPAYVQGLQNRSVSFERLETQQCMEKYAVAYPADRKSVLVVVEKALMEKPSWRWRYHPHQSVFAPGSTTYGGSVLTIDISTTPGPRSLYNPHEWICDYAGGHPPCFARAGSNEGINRTLHGRRILYCLSEIVEETCALEVILPVSLLLLGMLGF